MISAFRKQLHGGFLKVVIWLMVFAIGGITIVVQLANRFWGGANITGVAQVNGYDISNFEFRKALQGVQEGIRNIRQRFGKDANKILKERGLDGNPREFALKQVARQKALLAAADGIGVKISSDFITKKIQDSEFVKQGLLDIISPELLEGGSLDYKTLLKALRYQGVSVKCFENVVKERIKGQSVISFALAGAYTPEFLLRNIFNKNSQPKKFEIIEVPFSWYKEKVSSEKISDAELRNYFNRMSQYGSYWTPEKRSGYVWTFENVDEKEFVDEAKKLLESAQNLDPFIKKYGGVKKETGDLFSDKKDKSLLSKEIFKLYLKGRNAFFENGKGFVVELDKIEPGHAQSFEEVKDRVLGDYAPQKSMSLVMQDLFRLSSGNASDKELNDWVESHSAKKEVTEFLNPLNDLDWKSLSKKGFSVQDINRLKFIDKIGKREIFFTKNEGGYLVILKELASYVESKKLDEKFDMEKSALVKENFFAEADPVVKGFVDSLEKNATIKRNTRLMGMF